MTALTDLEIEFGKHFIKVWRCKNFPGDKNPEERNGCGEASMGGLWKESGCWIPDRSYFRPWGGFLGKNYKRILIVGGSPSALGILEREKGGSKKTLTRDEDKEAFMRTKKFVDRWDDENIDANQETFKREFEDLMDYYKRDWIPKWGRVLIAELAADSELIDCVAYINLVCCRCVKEKERGEYKNFNIWEKGVICEEHFKEAVKTLNPELIVGMWKNLENVLKTTKITEGIKNQLYWKGRANKLDPNNSAIMKNIIEMLQKSSNPKV